MSASASEAGYGETSPKLREGGSSWGRCGSLRQAQAADPSPLKTLFHELAHVLLGHTAEALQAESETTPRTLREAEAEAVALLCCEAVGMPGADDSRAYIQHWYGQGNPIPERSAQRILRVADQILRAGQSEPASESDDEGGRP